ncbi:glycosyltransferase family 39 protein [Corallococcus sp. CA053C]|uniref:ArnT family glycosyltransferase n=1 Tax=Corallococcus sp. CA053C TaxID=2316732 RepID=UPI001315A413|nr:glycosyltransferase 87 family protein [Corallococcus sp. CA053C]
MALGAWVLRAMAFFDRAGPLAYAMDYDEGVYFSAASLLLRGDLPYRDFIFVHPPGALLLWAPGAALTLGLDAATAYGVTRYLAATVGALCVFLAGRVAWRAWGPLAGCVAALAYATHPEAALVERGAFLEPLLNILCLGFANLWLASEPPSRARRIGAGVLLGLAVSVKLPGGLWLISALLARPWKESWRDGLTLALVAFATFVVVVGPLAALAPSEFFRDVITFQALRPSDGEQDRWLRLHEILHERRLGEVVLALVGLGVACVHAFRAPTPSRPAARFFAATFVLTVATFLASRTYWSQYNAHLAASEAVLAGLGASALHAFSLRWGRVASRAVAGLVLVAASLPGAWHVVQGSRQQFLDVVALANHVRTDVPRDACLFAFEPGQALVAGRLPMGATPVVDTYATMIQDAMSTGDRFPDTNEAFAAPEAQQALRVMLGSCRFVILGWQGTWQLTRESMPWFKKHFVRRFPPADTGGVGLWERRDGP